MSVVFIHSAIRREKKGRYQSHSSAHASGHIEFREFSSCSRTKRHSTTEPHALIGSRDTAECITLDWGSETGEAVRECGGKVQVL